MKGGGEEEGQIRNLFSRKAAGIVPKAYINSMMLPKISKTGIDVTKHSKISYSAKYYSDTR